MKYIAVIVAIIGLSSSLLCQEQQESTAGPHQMTFAINPLFIPLGTITGEVECGLIFPQASLGVSAWYEFKKIHARWVYAKMVYYTSGVALRGLGIGLTSGVLRAYRSENRTDQLAFDTSPIVGAMVQYNWFFGSRDNILIGAGFGARLTLKDYQTSSPLWRSDGDARIVFGMAL